MKHGKLFNALSFLCLLFAASCEMTTTDPDDTSGAILIDNDNFSAKDLVWNDHNPDGVDYIIRDKAVFMSNSTLTIEPGTEIVFENEAYLRLSNSTLKAVGTASNRIVFRGEDNTAGFWDGVILEGHNDNELTYCTIRDAGDAEHNGSSTAALVVGTEIAEAGLGMRHCIITNCTNHGIYVYDDSNLNEFEGNTIDNCDYPAYIEVDALGQLNGGGNTLSGNTNDRIIVEGDDVYRAATWADLGVPYFFTDETRIKNEVTVSPGVDMMFESNAELTITKNTSTLGKLFATGTSTRQIRFRGGNNVAGYWKGIAMTSGEAAFSYCQFSDAGNQGTSSVKGCIHFTQATHSISASMQHCMVSNSSSNGIVIRDNDIAAVTLTDMQFSDLVGQGIVYY